MDLLRENTFIKEFEGNFYRYWYAVATVGVFPVRNFFVYPLQLLSCRKARGENLK